MIPGSRLDPTLEELLKSAKTRQESMTSAQRNEDFLRQSASMVRVSFSRE